MDVVPRPPALKSPERLVTLCMALFASAAYAGTLGSTLAHLPANVVVVSTVVATVLWTLAVRPGKRGMAMAAVMVPALLVLLPWGAQHGVPAAAFFVALGCGAATALVWRSTFADLHLTSHEGALDRLERVGARAAMLTGVAGCFAALARPWATNVVGFVAVAAAAGTLLVLLARDRRRRDFLRTVYAGTAKDLVVVSETEIHGFAELPPLLSGVVTDAVLAHKATEVDSYRAMAGLRPIARCQHTVREALGIVERRGSHIVMSLGLLLGAFPAVVVVHLHASAPVPIAAAAGPELVAPRCVEARAYFQDAIPAAVPGVGRVALLTHAQDETIAAGEGLLLVLPEGKGGASRSMLDAVLAAARRVPCRDKLVLQAGEPELHPVDVEAWLTVDGVANRADVQREADDVVRELFQRDTRAVRTEHVDFGSEDKSVGFRIRYALQHVPGSRHVKLHVNGHDGEELLSPREYPTLRSLAIHVD